MGDDKTTSSTSASSDDRYPRDFVDVISRKWLRLTSLFAPGRLGEWLVDVSDQLLENLITTAFFASLRTEEKQHLRQAFVLVPDVESLRRFRWQLALFPSPVPLDGGRIAKLAPALSQNEFLVLTVSGDNARLVGLGAPFDDGMGFSDDSLPRLRAVAPGHLVFSQGSRAVVEYRAGRLDRFQSDFFRSSTFFAPFLQPNASALFGTSPPGGDNDESLLAVAQLCSELVSAIAAIGHGGLVAVLPSEEAPPLTCDYPIGEVGLGDALVEATTTGRRAIDLRPLSSPSSPGPQVSTEALTAADRAAEGASAHLKRMIPFIASLSAVDGAVLMSVAFRVLGFGCKLPGRDDTKPLSVLQPSSDGDAFISFDMTRKGTRHAAAARFAADHPGGLAFIVSADGPAACFVWSDKHNAVVYWPIHPGR